jgi:electron transfer flavoprotein alpha subunit
MKTLLVAEHREGKLQGGVYELIAFAKKIGAESAIFLVGSESDLPKFSGTLYLADVASCGEYNPDVHKQLLLETVAKVKPDMVVFSHSSYGWDLAPRVAHNLKAAQVSEVVDFVDGLPVVPVCNSKLRRKVGGNTSTSVLTLQAGAFSLGEEPSGAPTVEKIGAGPAGKIEFVG